MVLLALVSIQLCLFSCASVKTVKPMNKEEKKLTADLGGPMIKFSGLPIFIPLTSVGAGYGFSNSVSGFASLHTTSLLYGTLQLETTANLALKNLAHSGFTTNVGIYTFFRFRESKASFYPLIDLSYYWHYTRQEKYLYTSLTFLRELHRRKAYEKLVENRIIPNFIIGHRGKPTFFVVAWYKR